MVSAQFFHSPVAREHERTKVLGRAAEAVEVGGVLLIAGHAGWPSFVEHRHDVHFPTMDEVLDGLALGADWRVETKEAVEREVTWPEGQVGMRTDTVLRIRRMR